MIRTRSTQFIMLLSLAAYFLYPVQATNQWPVAELLTKPLKEDIRAEVPSSMAEFSGVVVETAVLNNGYPHVLLPAGWNDGVLCLEVRSRDGRYYSENEYKISETPKTSTFIFLPYESKKIG